MKLWRATKLNSSLGIQAKEKFNATEQCIIDNEIDKLLDKGVIEVTQHCRGEFISPIFIRSKKDGSHRMILNLKDLNTNVEYHHFQMETLQSAIALMRPGCHMASIDLRDAYYCVPIDTDYKKYLKFYWKGILYQFTCLPNGLASGPRVFTKIVKPIYSMLIQLGYLNTSYIDDSYLQGDTVQECQDNVSKTDHLLTQAGFVTHPDKSVYEPTQKLTFLGFALNSIKMRVTLTPERTANLKQLCLHALKHPKLTIRELAQLIGTLVSSLPGMQYGPLHYRSLEFLKTKALSLNKGNFDAVLTINSAGMEDLQWWVDNIERAFKPAVLPKADLPMHTDASKMGWGAIINGTTTGGRWTSLESQERINILALRAMLWD